MNIPNLSSTFHFVHQCSAQYAPSASILKNASELTEKVVRFFFESCAIASGENSTRLIALTLLGLSIVAVFLLKKFFKIPLEQRIQLDNADQETLKMQLQSARCQELVLDLTSYQGTALPELPDNVVTILISEGKLKTLQIPPSVKALRIQGCKELKDLSIDSKNLRQLELIDLDLQSISFQQKATLETLKITECNQLEIGQNELDISQLTRLNYYNNKQNPTQFIQQFGEVDLSLLSYIQISALEASEKPLSDLTTLTNIEELVIRDCTTALDEKVLWPERIKKLVFFMTSKEQPLRIPSYDTFSTTPTEIQFVGVKDVENLAALSSLSTIQYWLTECDVNFENDLKEARRNNGGFFISSKAKFDAW